MTAYEIVTTLTTFAASAMATFQWNAKRKSKAEITSIEIKNLQEVIRSMGEEINRLKQELTELRADNNKQREELSTMRTENRTLRDELNEIKLKTA